VCFVLLGRSTRVAIEVLQAVRSFSDGKCLIAGDEPSRPLRWSAHCARHVMTALDGSGDDEFVTLVHGLAAANPQTVLIPFDCDGIRMAQRLQGRLQVQTVPVPDVATLDALEDKWSFHAFCTQHALPVPLTRFVGTKEAIDFDAVATEFGLPFVLKPTNWSGSLGVQIVTSRAQFEQRILGDARYAFDTLIVQQFIEGDDACLSVLANRGRLRAFAIQQPIQNRIEFMPNAGLEAIASQICRDSVYHGVMNLDVRIEKHTGRLFLIEANPRFYASLTASVACGLNFVAESIDLADPVSEPKRLVAGRFEKRHPLLTPFLWPCLLLDPDARGRLLRAKAFDLFTFGMLARELPLTALRQARRLAARVVGPLRPGSEAVIGGADKAGAI
jgi:predicted ATP-grasp superfamily ATP-dependent carboligase